MLQFIVVCSHTGFVFVGETDLTKSFQIGLLLLYSNKMVETVIPVQSLVGVSKALKSHGISHCGSHVIELEN